MKGGDNLLLGVTILDRLLLDQAQLGLEGFPLLLLDTELVSRLQ